MTDELYDPLADNDVAEAAANLYLTTAQTRAKVRALMVANGDSEDTPMPGGGFKRQPDGTVLINDGVPEVQSYGDAIQQGEERMQRIRDAYEGIWPAIERLLEERKKQLTEASA